MIHIKGEEKMRTFKEFNKQMEEAHLCSKCKGKIFTITVRNGRTCCAYCGEPVDYPIPTREEIKAWIGNEAIRKAMMNEFIINPSSKNTRRNK